MVGFLKPVLDRSIVVDNYIGDFFEEEVKISYYYVFVVQVGTSAFPFVLAACCEHASSGGVMWSSDNFSKEAELSCSYHVLDAGDVVEHAAYFLVADVVFLDGGDRNVDDPANILVQEYFELSEEGLAE